MHNVLKWYFAQHKHQKIGATMPRSGRAAVVKRYEELSMAPGANPVHDLAQIVASHGLIDPLSTKNDGTEPGPANVQADYEMNVCHQQQEETKEGAALGLPPRNYVLENKNPHALEALRPERVQAALAKRSVRRRSSMVLVQQRKEEIIAQKAEDIRTKTLHRLVAIRADMDRIEGERRSRMWFTFFATTRFFSKTVGPIVEAREREEAAVKMQTLFRKSLYKQRGPAMLKVMSLFQRRLLPKLVRIRRRIQVRDADQVLLFLQDVKEMGKFTQAIREFKRNLTFTQRLVRDYIAVSRAREDLLERVWLQHERERHQEKVSQARREVNLKHGRLAARGGESCKKKTKHKAQQMKQQQAASANQHQKQPHHRKRKQAALRLLGKDVSNLKRIEKHIEAQEHAEIAFRESIASRVPRIPATVRRHMIRVYLARRRKAHIEAITEEHGGGHAAAAASAEFTTDDMREMLAATGDEAGLLQDMAKAHSRSHRPWMRGMFLLTGNAYHQHQGQQAPRTVHDDMRGLLDEGVKLANEKALQAKQEKKSRTSASRTIEMDRGTALSNGDLHTILRRSSVSMSSNPDHARAATDYLRTMLEENEGMFV